MLPRFKKLPRTLSDVRISIILFVTSLNILICAVSCLQDLNFDRLADYSEAAEGAKLSSDYAAARQKEAARLKEL